MLSFLRVIKFALQDIVRNAGLSFMTVLILVLMLLSINTLVIINVLTKEAINTIEDQIDVSIYFNHEATDKEVEEVQRYAQSFPEVTGIKFLTREEVLNNFKELHKDDTNILSSLDELGANPLGPTMILKTRQPDDYKKIIEALNIPEYENIIESKTFGDTEKAITKISSITSQVEKFGFGLSILFALIAFLIILNTIRVSIYTQRIEIVIKKLVGATNWFVRGPYLIEALIFTFLSLAVSLAFVFLSVHFLEPYVTVIFNKPQILTNYFTSNIILLVFGEFLAVLFLTVISSLLAMNKYLKA